MDMTLVVMAAGLGSRYGGVKQIERLGPDGEILMEYAIYDALCAGFDRIVLIIKPQMLQDVRALFGDRIEQRTGVRIDYAFQTPDRFTAARPELAQRSKPLGTVHAVLCARDVIETPFAVINADDFYGRGAIDAIAAGKEAAISLHRYVHPGQTLTAGRDRRVYKALDKDHVLIETAGFDKDHRQTPGYNAAKAKTFSDARVTFTEEQVRKECARCLGCGATKVDSYLCIGCGLCTTKCKFDAIHLKKVRDWHAGSYETMPIKVAEGVVKRAGSLVKKAVSK